MPDAAQSANAAMGNARSASLSWRWVWAALLLLFCATLVAILQPPGPVPAGRGAAALPFPNALLYPVEANPHRRLPEVTVSLTSLSFLADGQRGWAVGDGGAIVATQDGGRTWAAQISGTTQRLNSLSFLADGQRGWAVGDGGAIVATQDGGRTWTYAEPYARYPAPWYWLVVLFCAALLWMAWLRRSKADRECVADVAASDAAVASFADDRLEFAGLARGISRFLRNPETTPPLTLAITGDWGSGKSSLMQLVCADLRRTGNRPIWFNAWHHQKEEHLFAALLGAVRSQAIPPWWTPAGVSFRARLLWLRSKKHFLVSMILALTVSALLVYGVAQRDGMGALVTLAQRVVTLENVLLNHAPEKAATGTDAGNPKTPANPEATEGQANPLLPAALAQLFALLTAIAAAAKGMKTFGVNPAVLMAEAKQSMGIRLATAQNDFRTTFAREFKEVTEALPYRLVIVIDDLDRCRPQAVLEVMEVVNFLTSAGACFVIFGMAAERVQAALGLAFVDIARELVNVQGEDVEVAAPQDKDAAEREKRRAYARDYLQKLVNLEITVPTRKDLAAERLLTLPEPPSRRWFADFVRTLAAPWPFYAAALAIASGVVIGQSVAPATKPAEQAVVTPTATVTPAPVKSADVKPPAVVEPKPQTRPAEQFAGVQPGASQPLMVTVTWLALAVGALAVVFLVILLRGLRAAIMDVRDSGEFKQALAIWSGVVARKRSTPRAIKRFGNRIRYFAMLQQAEAPDESFWAVVGREFAALRTRWRSGSKASPGTSMSTPPGTPPTIRPDALADHQLIAMGALYEIHGRDWTNHLTPAPGVTDEAIFSHCSKFAVPWPPSDAEQKVFEKLLGGIRLAGDPRTLDPRSAGTGPVPPHPSTDPTDSGMEFESDAKLGGSPAFKARSVPK